MVVHGQQDGPNSGEDFEAKAVSHCDKVRAIVPRASGNYPPSKSLSEGAGVYAEFIFVGVRFFIAIMNQDGDATRVAVTRLPNKALRGAMYLVLCITLTPALSPLLAAQSDAPSHSPSRFEHEKQLPLNILKDQVAIWTSPLHMQLKPMLFVGAMGVASAIVAVNDDDITQALGQDANRERISGYISHAGTLPVNFGVAGGTWAIGRLTKNSYLADTGLLTLEALTDTSIITGIAKVASDRKRPIDGGDGTFLNGGRSFFSGHASLSWTTATIFASRYPHKPWVKYPAYGLATAVSVSRFTARRHFASDVLVGTTVGILIGRYVARKRGDELSSRVSFMPVSNLRTQTFGVRISFNPPF